MVCSAGQETPAGMSDSRKAPGCSYGCAGGCCCGLCCQRGITAEQVREIILKEAEIPDEDLLHYSHNNAVGGHLPYIIALDRQAGHPPIPSTKRLSDLSVLSFCNSKNGFHWLCALHLLPSRLECSHLWLQGTALNDAYSPRRLHPAGCHDHRAVGLCTGLAASAGAALNNSRTSPGSASS